MAEFLIKVADERGRLVEQVENGYSEAEVRDRFVQQGYLVYWVKPRGILTASKLSLSNRGEAKQSKCLVFSQQILTRIKAGLQILQSLDLLIKGKSDKNLHALLDHVRVKGKSESVL